jgi:hypothetical protein
MCCATLLAPAAACDCCNHLICCCCFCSCCSCASSTLPLHGAACGTIGAAVCVHAETSPTAYTLLLTWSTRWLTSVMTWPSCVNGSDAANSCAHRCAQQQSVVAVAAVVYRSESECAYVALWLSLQAKGNVKCTALMIIQSYSAVRVHRQNTSALNQ